MKTATLLSIGALTHPPWQSNRSPLIKTKTFSFLSFQEINHPPRGGVFIITEHNIATVSHLVIKNVTIADSGQYACSTSAKSRAYVTLHVINSEFI